MRLLTYADLATLRLRDYVGDGVKIEIEESGMEGLVGLGGWERLGETYFTWRQGEPYQTAGVDIDLGPDSQLPKSGVERLLKRLGVPVAPGMMELEVLSAIGSPEATGQLGRRLLRFVCGEREEFLIGCVLDGEKGLNKLFLARKDYCDEDDAL